jgi:uncharacterized protein YlxP (DUF503 family)
MVVGILRLELQVPGNRSLKGKRAALRPLIAALVREFSVSVAEVEHQDSWQQAVLGVCVASSDRRQADRVLQAVLRRTEEWSGDTVLQSTAMELINVDPR